MWFLYGCLCGAIGSVVGGMLLGYLNEKHPRWSIVNFATSFLTGTVITVSLCGIPFTFFGVTA